MGIHSMTLTVQKPIIYAGEMINGLLTIAVSSPINVGAIELKFEGCADVHWTETRTRSYTDSEGKSQTETYEESYSSHEKIICVNRDVVIQGGFLQAGTYTLPFFFETPYNLVSSFEGAHGSVRYYVKTKKPKSGLAALFPTTYRAFVKVLQPIDINIPMYMFPVSGVDTKTICCLCCASGPLTIEARTDRAAYCPGEVALINARFENNSSRQVKPYIRLVQHQKFYASGSSNYYSKTYDLRPVRDNGDTAHYLAEGGSTSWTDLAFQIPACYPSLKCQIIDVSYCIEVAMDIPMAFDLKVSLPLIMGTIPYRGPQVITQQAAVPSYQTGWVGVGAQSGMPMPPPPPIAEADGNVKFEEAPPSYFETVFADDAAKGEAAVKNKQSKDKKI